MTAVLDRPDVPLAGGVVAAGRRARARRRRTVVAVLVGALLAVAVVTLCIGERSYSPLEVLRVLLGEQVPGASFTIESLRLPRLLTGLLVGLGFGMGGVVFQTMLRNPLASPDIIGISAGSSAAAVLAITVLGLSGAVLAGVAVVAGVAVAGAIYALSWRRGVQGARLILIGIAVGAMLDSVISYAMTRAGVYDANEALRWLTGSLNSAFWPGVGPLALAMAVLVPTLLVLSRRLTALQLGDDAAAALGVRPDRARLALLVVAVAMVAVATAAAGPIAFVAFLSGPIAHRLVRGTGSLLVPAALVGALLVLVGDFTGQHLLVARFPVGVVTGVLGAPYLLWLLARTNRSGGSL
ncbi:MAG: iron chelate uptake ABC transporter family permease subunit [Cellulomonas sp.]|uniref:ABC transporter permease n=1 Tax=Cellulomonas gelida TaxID=1712 RepID=A0A4Y3KI51_9CELL|nr:MULTISPECIES: iron chelate uptake ABC transporter family permease subunit [Cellulomonas]KMM45142.1 ABC transporter permease [Cellulomonas sp. A375-1]MCR6648224.1 iron chelate uptake ABC transporter family permease subunit [Cellulomonas sp.]MCR6704160.1 iron chelate uptake ABC transporter family permease subunit [Cellulomonas sp.]GEA83672.1 ABC transporter permease [Cellulomonas gelida]GGL22728.1 ABC transporter permease [Cellulomonas gelida]